LIKLNNIEDSGDDEYVFSLKGEKSRDLPKVSVKIEGLDVRMMIDFQSCFPFLQLGVVQYLWL
jgi:hypothetical protein